MHACMHDGPFSDVPHVFSLRFTAPFFLLVSWFLNLRVNKLNHHAQKAIRDRRLGAQGRHLAGRTASGQFCDREGNAGQLQDFADYVFFCWLMLVKTCQNLTSRKRIQNHNAVWFPEVNHGLKGLRDIKRV